MPRQGTNIHKSITEDRVIATCMRRMNSLDDPGICLSCGEDTDGVEPDAERYLCVHCGNHSVYGSDQILIGGFYHPDKPMRTRD